MPGTGAQFAAMVDDGALMLSIVANAEGVPRIVRLAPGPGGATDPGEVVGAASGGAVVPLVDVLTPMTGRRASGNRYVDSVLGARLRHRGDAVHDDGPWREIHVELGDAQTRLRADVFLRVLTGEGVLRASVELTNEGDEPLLIDSVSSFLCGGAGLGSATDLDLFWAENEWLAEGRWHSSSVPRRRAWNESQHQLGQPAVKLYGYQHGLMVLGHSPAGGCAGQPADRAVLGLADRAQRGMALASG